MTIKELQSLLITAMKEKNETEKSVYSSAVSAVKNAAIASKCREEIPEDMVNQVLLKEQKTIQEMIDTCPAEREDLLSLYKEKYEIISKIAPQLLSDPTEIEQFIRNLGIELVKKNRGSINHALKGKADLKIANQILGRILV